ncbi:MAG: choice-of-anchor D domain-containing protein [Acidipila sp.]|nr:choice-of-anchor D domain-containing protein [Acidipila sp.]
MTTKGYFAPLLGAAAVLVVGSSLLFTMSDGPQAGIEWGAKHSSAPAAGKSAAAAGAAANLANLPLRFETNQGQAGNDAQFVARGPGYNVLLNGAEATLVLDRASTPARPVHTTPQERMREAQQRSADRAVVSMEMVGANRATVAQGVGRLETKSNYFIGSDPSKWHRNVPNYARVRYQEIYPGVDLVYYGKDRRLEYDLLVAAGADPDVIRMRYTGAESMRVDRDGALVLQVKGREIRQVAPNAYQTVAGETHSVTASYILKGTEVQIALGNYDRSQSLVIDPAIVYSTYFGGSGDDTGRAIAVDGSGNVYLTGDSTSTNLPTTGHTFPPFQAALGSGGDSAYVAELNSTASAVIFATYLGGNTFDEGDAIAVDATGVYVGGVTASSNFPVTVGAAQPTFLAAAGQTNGWLAKLDPNGQNLIYATYLGGGGSDFVNSLTVDAAGIVYATGSTISGTINGGNPPDFPVTAGVVQPTFGGTNATPGLSGTGDAFLTKLSADGTTFLYSTYLGGSGDEEGWAILVDGSGNAFVAGDSTTTTQFPMPASPGVIQPGPPAKTVPAHFTAFVTEVNPTATALSFFTYLGGSGDDQLRGMARDASGNIYMTGSTTSPDFPVTAGAAQPALAGGSPFGDAYVTKINATGTAKVYSTYLGGSDNDAGADIRVDTNGFAYVVGFTMSNNFPVTASAVQAALAGTQNAFITRLSPDGSLFVFSTYYGGTGVATTQRMALDASNSVYFTGFTSSPFPTTAGVVQPVFGGGATDAFAVKVDATVPVGASVPTLVAFGNQMINTTSAPQTVTYTNIGNQPLILSGVAISASYSQTNNCGTLPVTLAPGASCVFTLTFTPTANGATPGTLTLTDNAAGSPRVVMLTGTGTSASGPVASLTPSSTVTFGSQPVGTTSASQTVTLTNTGNATLNISNISALGGANPGDFTSINTCGATLAANASCTFTFTFTPAAAGARSATVVITSDSGGVAGTMQTITLNGTGGVVSPTATFTPSTTLTFGSQAVGSTSASQTITLTNTGTAPLNISNISAVGGTNPGDFISNNNCGATLAVGASCTFAVTFTPASAGARSATVVVTSNSGNVPGTMQTLTFNGTGGVPSFTLSATNTTATVSPGQSASYPITITPVGGFNQAVSLSCSGAPAGATCTVVPSSVTLNGVSPASATVQVTTSAGGNLLPRPQSRNGNPPWFLVVLAMTIAALGAGMGLKVVPARVRGQYLAPTALVLLIVGLTVFAAACGDKDGSGTPKGTSTLVVTGTGGGQTQTLNLTLIVQ